MSVDKWFYFCDNRYMIKGKTVTMYDWFKELEPEIQKRMTIKLDRSTMLELVFQDRFFNDTAQAVLAFEDIEEEENAAFKHFKEVFNQLFDTLQKSGICNDEIWILINW